MSSPKVHKWLVLISLGIGTFMSALDASIVNAILPIIQQKLHTQLDAVQWVVTVYLLIVSGLLLTFGRLGDIWGHRPVCVWGFALFVSGSVLCGLAPGITMLIAARGCQAIGAAMIFASSPAILTKTFPAAQRGQALGLQATMTYLGLAFGPSLGGWLTDAFGWQSVFFVNVPVGAVAIAACRRFVPVDARHAMREPFDWAGALTFMVGLLALLLALNQAHQWGWHSWPIIGLFVVSMAFLAAFVQIQRRSLYPMLDLTLFRRLLFSMSLLSALLNYTCTAMITFLMPFYLIRHLGWSPSKAGTLLTVQPLMMAIAAPTSGTISDRLRHPSLPATLGMAVMTVGVGWLGCLKPDSGWLAIAVGLAVVGLGTGAFISPNNSALMGSAPRHRQGIAAGMMATARNLGMVLGVGLAGAVATTVLAYRPGATLHDAIVMSFWVAVGLATVGIFTSAARS
ncbi:MAG: MFS transporter [Thermoguttaceae bacterium]